MNIAVLVLLLASTAVHVEVVEDNRFKISSVIADPKSPKEQFNAQIGIIKKAQQFCKSMKRGDAVSEGKLYADNLPPAEGKKRERLQISEFYSCRVS